jgi:lipopolysaccharide/colanic/teichoic acid biosynthesis glycosyltransferase
MALVGMALVVTAEVAEARTSSAAAARRARTQRVLDVAGALLILGVASPLLALAALLILLTMGRPIFYRERCAGQGGRPFTRLKLRTMRPAPCPNWPDELRITRVGRLLRAAAIDELPQLWNVLRGDMALSGPRPVRADSLGRFVTEEALRQAARPGITRRRARYARQPSRRKASRQATSTQPYAWRPASGGLYGRMPAR